MAAWSVLGLLPSPSRRRMAQPCSPPGASPIVPGYEQATVRLAPDGGLEIRVGVQSHGQGLETTLAQIASEVVGIEPSRVTVIHGDTSLTPYSTGTYASRSIVMAGGAVARACRVLAERIRRIAAHLFRCSIAEVIVHEGKLWGPHAEHRLRRDWTRLAFQPRRVAARRRRRWRRSDGRLSARPRQRRLLILDPC